MLREAVNGDDIVRMTYEADGQLILHEDNGVLTVRLHDGVFEEVVYGPGNTTTKQYRFGGQLVAQRLGTQVTFLRTDHLGGVVSQITATGVSEGRVRRDPWGKELWRGGSLQSNSLFTGQRWDSRLGMYDYNARYYDAEIGRFISSDTIIPDAMRAVGLNRYAYVYNSPQSHTDSTGHHPDHAGHTDSIYIDEDNVSNAEDASETAANPQPSTKEELGGHVFGGVIGYLLGIGATVVGGSPDPYSKGALALAMIGSFLGNIFNPFDDPPSDQVMAELSAIESAIKDNTYEKNGVLYYDDGNEPSQEDKIVIGMSIMFRSSHTDDSVRLTVFLHLEDGSSVNIYDEDVDTHTARLVYEAMEEIGGQWENTSGGTSGADAYPPATPWHNAPYGEPTTPEQPRSPEEWQEPYPTEGEQYDPYRSMNNTTMR